MNFHKKNTINIKKKNFFKNIFYYIKKNIKYFILFLFFFVISFFFIFFYYSDCKNFYKNLYFHNKNINFKKISNIKEDICTNSKNFKYQFISEKKKKINKKNILNKNFKNSLPGFELLDQEKFGISSFNEQINYQRALEGELSRTIEKLNFINNARVHLSIPHNSYILNKKNYSSASVFINLDKENKFNFEIYYSIINLLSTSISNLPKKNITVINQFGELFTESNYNFLNKINFSKINYIHNIEDQYKNKIDNILIPIFGLNNFVTQVTATIDFNKKNNITYDNCSESNENNLNSSVSYKNYKTINLKKKNIYNNFYNFIYSYSKINFFKKIKLNKLFFLNQFYKNNIKNNILLNKNININANKKNDNINLNNKNINTKTNSNIQHLCITIVVNYKKNSSGKYVPLNTNEILDIKKLTRQTIESSLCRIDSLNVFNYKFMDLEPPIIKYVPIKKKESIDRMIFLAPWFILFLFLIFFITSFVSFKKFTKKFQINNLNMLSVFKKHFENNDNVIKENFKKNTKKINNKINKIKKKYNSLKKD
ncbi:flagellar basal-body MS-ring/collar protein FliF [Buchnera aphidicola]|uniref:flagellar basal-body MS-ring/collar protein FliF n=1 Tax=Buchnera aphidicola TaxID=9 RepID=UPI0031B7EE4E